MRTGFRSAGNFHSHFAERTENGHLKRGGGDLHVVVVQLFDDQVASEARIAGSAFLQSVQQIVGAAFHDQPNANDPSRKIYIIVKLL
jgi:hypothetical protein